jgi:hypothetical protein
MQMERLQMNAKHLKDLWSPRRVLNEGPVPCSHRLCQSTFRRMLPAAAGLAGILGLAGPAVADEIVVDNVQLPYYEIVNLNGYIDGNFYSDDGQMAGQIVLTVNAPPSTKQYMLGVWCDDIFHDIYLGGSGYVYTPGSLTTDNSDNPTQLTSTQIKEISDLVSYGDAQMKSNPSALLSAEVQAAIWTVEYNNPSIDNSLSVTSNAFDATDLTALENDAFKAEGGAVQLISLDGTQAELYAAPEPGSFALLSAGLVVFGMAGRMWRQRRHG